MSHSCLGQCGYSSGRTQTARTQKAPWQRRQCNPSVRLMPQYRMQQMDGFLVFLADLGFRQTEKSTRAQGKGLCFGFAKQCYDFTKTVKPWICCWSKNTRNEKVDIYPWTATVMCPFPTQLWSTTAHLPTFLFFSSFCQRCVLVVLLFLWKHFRGTVNFASDFSRYGIPFCPLSAFSDTLECFLHWHPCSKTQDNYNLHGCKLGYWVFFFPSVGVWLGNRFDDQLNIYTQVTRLDLYNLSMCKYIARMSSFVPEDTGTGMQKGDVFHTLCAGHLKPHFCLNKFTCAYRWIMCKFGTSRMWVKATTGNVNGHKRAWAELGTLRKRWAKAILLCTFHQWPKLR